MAAMFNYLEDKTDSIAAPTFSSIFQGKLRENVSPKD